MNYTVKKFEHLLGLSGFSDTLLTNHFTLYGGYVNNVNTLSLLLKKTEQGTASFSELSRRFAWEWNGMRLHELYFENMTKEATSLSSGELSQVVDFVWGSFENWEKEFRTLASMRGIGWVVLAYDTEAKRVFNIWINEHDVGHLAGAKPLLVMDVFEHAYMTDYGIKRAEYISAFMKAIDWNVVSKRLLS